MGSNERKEALRVMAAVGKGFLQTPECREAGKRTCKAAEAVELFLCNIAEAFQKELFPAKIRTGFYFPVPVQVFPFFPQHGFCVQPLARKKVMQEKPGRVPGMLYWVQERFCVKPEVNEYPEEIQVSTSGWIFLKTTLRAHAIYAIILISRL